MPYACAACRDALRSACQAFKERWVTKNMFPAPADRAEQNHNALVAYARGKKLSKRKAAEEQLRDEEGAKRKKTKEDDEIAKRCEIGFADSGSVTAKSKGFKTDRGTIRETMASNAYCWLQREIDQMESVMTEYADLEPGDLEMVWDRLKFDAAQQWLTVDVFDFVVPQQRVSSWPVMVARRWVGWRTKEGVEDEMVITIPPVLLVGCECASTLEDALVNRSWRPHA